MDLVQKMREARTRPNDAMPLIATVCRDRPWTEVVFRAENGITEFYTLLDTCVGGNVALKTGVDVGAACTELTRTQRNYIVHNETVQTSLIRMLLKLSTMRESGAAPDSSTVDALCGTLRETILPFCLFAHGHMCTHAVAEIRTVLFDLVFHAETSVLEQWPEWSTDEKKSTGVVGEKTCPITLDVIVDGIVASDGHLYERSALLKHMTDKRESPMTREYLDLDFVTFTSGY
jgi:hypothetical protein